MKYLFSIVPILFLLTARTCDQKVAEDQGPVFQLGENLTIAYGQSMTLKGEELTLTYNDLKESRCPEGVQCIRAGEALVQISLKKGADTGTVSLEAEGLCQDETGKCGTSAAAMGYKFQLLSVNPYPQNAGKSPKESTQLTVVVNKQN